MGSTLFRSSPDPLPRKGGVVLAVVRVDHGLGHHG